MSKRIVLVAAVVVGAILVGCGTTYPVTVIDNTDSLLVIRATGKTKYDALKAAKAKATELLGNYVAKKPADCNYNPGQGSQNIGGSGVYENVGSWHECVIYAQKTPADGPEE